MSATLSRAVRMSTGVRMLLRPERLQHLEAVPLGQHHVEDDEVVGRTAVHEVERDGAVAGDLDRMPFLLEPLAEKARDLPLVFHDEDPHALQPG